MARRRWKAPRPTTGATRCAGLREIGRWKGLAQALLFHETACRGDVPGAAALLDEVDSWRGFRQQPPRFVLLDLLALVSRQPGLPAWKRSLPRWLQLWDLTALGPEGQTLAVQAGLAPAAQLSAPPAGVPAAAWFLHLATRALGSRTEDPSEALACVRRALEADPELAGRTEVNVVREVLPELERRALARSLAGLVQPEGRHETIPAGLLVDAVDLLRSFPEGQALLETLQRDDPEHSRLLLQEVLQKPEVPHRLLHHLALLELRTAQQLEEQEQTDLAEPFWRRAWRAWLRWLASPPRQGGEEATPLPDDDRSRLLDWSAGPAPQPGQRFAGPRRGGPRRGGTGTWSRNYPPRRLPLSEPLSRDLGQHLARFRDDLAGEYLVTTREAMRYGRHCRGHAC